MFGAVTSSDSNIPLSSPQLYPSPKPSFHGLALSSPPVQQPPATGVSCAHACGKSDLRCALSVTETWYEKERTLAHEFFFYVGIMSE